MCGPKHEYLVCTWDSAWETAHKKNRLIGDHKVKIQLQLLYLNIFCRVGLLLIYDFLPLKLLLKIYLIKFYHKIFFLFTLINKRLPFFSFLLSLSIVESLFSGSVSADDPCETSLWFFSLLSMLSVWAELLASAVVIIWFSSCTSSEDGESGVLFNLKILC